MRPEDQKLITTFEARVRHLLLKLQKQQQEADELYSMVDERDQRIAQLEQKLGEAERRYDALLTARMLQLSDTDTKQAKARITSLIRDIDLCIAQVNAQA